MKKTYKKKNIKKGVHVIYDSKKLTNQLIQKIYSSILQLDTKTLEMHSHEVYAELMSRSDFDSLDNLCTRFQILADELKERGVDVSCLI